MRLAGVSNRALRCLVLSRQFSSVPEPPSTKSVKFNATVPPSTPHRFQHPTHNDTPSNAGNNTPQQPYFPNQENIAQYFEEIKTNMSTFK